jgi:hypothetical protein
MPGAPFGSGVAELEPMGSDAGTVAPLASQSDEPIRELTYPGFAGTGSEEDTVDGMSLPYSIVARLIEAEATSSESMGFSVSRGRWIRRETPLTSAGLGIYGHWEGTGGGVIKDWDGVEGSPAGAVNNVFQETTRFVMDGMIDNDSFLEHGLAQEGEVKKQIIRNFPCNKNARDIFHRLRTHFPDFANFKGSFNAGLANAQIEFGKTPITVDATIGISGTIRVPFPFDNPPGFVTEYNVSVRVVGVSLQADSSMGFTFETLPGHVLYPAQIAFSATDAGAGRLSFGVQIFGDINGLANNLSFSYFGGSALEDKIWNNLIDNVKKYCGN